MASNQAGHESLVACPYNPAHIVKRSRYQIHIAKCKMAYPEKNMKQCPFSADHVVPATEFMRHTYTCPLNNTISSLGHSTGTTSMLQLDTDWRIPYPALK
ncbi:gametocyte-specific factor 1 homolog [Dermacentor silvarum]|uniref:gametocyte-specific factor 1 homolog n=1 Tax=Dermacentor silvarum TaxID=543639 RepID=UPI002101BD4D|nr:gametocyte-specific factor 1 homolog [Dermacentor silvarum]